MRIAILAAALAIVGTPVGCGKKQPTGESRSQPVELLLYCGAGLRPVADELIRVFDSAHRTRIVADYAGSEVLLAKMKLIRKGDLVHARRQAVRGPGRPGADGLSQTPVCYFVPTILVQKGNPKNIQSLRDLTRPGLKVGFGDPQALRHREGDRQLSGQEPSSPGRTSRRTWSFSH